MKKSKKLSFAKIAEELAKKEAKYQKLLDNAKTEAQRNSASLMLDRISERREMLMEENRVMAEAANPAPVSAAPSQVPQFSLGTNTIPPGFLGGIYEAFSNMQRPKQTSVYDGLDIQAPIPNLPQVLTRDQEKEAMAKIAQEGKKNILDKALGTAGAVAPFIDNIGFKKYIDSIRPDTRPEEMRSANLNTKYNIEPQLAEARAAQGVFNRSLDRTNTNRGVVNANKLAGLAERMRNTNKLMGLKENTESQLKNQAALHRNSVGNQNVRIRNDHARGLVDFHNQKAAAKQANLVNISEDIGELNSQRLEQKYQEKYLEAMMPYLNRYKLNDKYYNEDGSLKTKVPTPGEEEEEGRALGGYAPPKNIQNLLKRILRTNE